MNLVSLHKIIPLLGLTATLFLTSPNKVQAQKNIDLKQCFELANANNVQLRQLKINELLSLVTLRQDKDNLLPSLNGNASYNYNLNSFRDQLVDNLFISRSNNLGLGINMNASLFEGFARLLTIKSSEINVDATQLETEIYRNNLQLSIFSAYLEILRAQEQVAIIETQTGLLEEQTRRTQKLIAGGVLPKGDLLELESQKAQQVATQTNAQNSVELAILNLQQLIRSSENFTVAPLKDLPVPTQSEFAQYSVDKIYADALGYRPEIAANQKRLSIAQYALKIADASRLPNLNFSSGFNTRYANTRLPSEASVFYSFNASQSSFFTQFYENIGWNMSFNASFPIFNKWIIRNSKERAQLAIENQKLSNESTEIELYKAIQQAYLSAKASSLNYQASQSAVLSAQNAYNMIQKKYELGAATSLETNTALNNLTISELNNNNARYAYIFAVKILDFYAGKPLEF